MNTPHHQTNIHHHTPDNPHNPVVRVPYNQHNPDNRLSDDHHYLHGRVPDGHHNPAGRHSSDNYLPDNRQNPVDCTEIRHVTGNYNTQYNNHHVKDTLTTRVIKLICAVFLGILFTIALVTFILWITLRPHRPHFHIQDFSILGLGDPNGFPTARITFNMTARNPNLDVGIYYDTMNLTIYYQDQSIAESPLLFPFYQSPRHTAIVYGTLSGPTLKINRARWGHLLAARRRGAVQIKVDVESYIRYKVSAWDGRHHKMHANCEIGVGSNGAILASDKKKKCPVYFT
ncbi:hypothetical protein LXL04_027137 [Taraxacum kok-saghyz]